MTTHHVPVIPPDESIRKNNAEPIERCHLGHIDYAEAWTLQAEAAVQRAEGEIGDRYLICEHESIYTAGKRTQPSDLPTSGPNCINVDRGGRITWHGPGQLVVYPIIALREPIDVIDYVRRLEEAIIITLKDIGVTHAGRVLGRSGVWIPGEGKAVDRKIAAIGIRITRGVAMHGLALNCCNTLEFYDYIVPCGITDAGVTTIQEVLGKAITMEAVTPRLLDALDACLEGRHVVGDHTLGSAPNPCG